jgi:hypothetical protein
VLRFFITLFFEKKPTSACQQQKKSKVQRNSKTVTFLCLVTFLKKTTNRIKTKQQIRQSSKAFKFYRERIITSKRIRIQISIQGKTNLWEILIHLHILIPFVFWERDMLYDDRHLFRLIFSSWCALLFSIYFGEVKNG